MNEKEIAEIRRRFHPEKSNITTIRGCYVNGKREIVSEFQQPLALLPPEETEGMLATLKRTLSGGIGKNLLDITFTTAQVVDSDEHRLLMALRSSALGDEAAVHTFYERVVASLTLDSNYLILLACDTYDVPHRSADGETAEDDSSEVFSYLLCSVCPVKLTKPALGFHAYDNQFCTLGADSVLAPPALGFLFPAFADRSADIYSALYYTRDKAENHPEFVEALFRSEIPMPAAAQKELFQAILTETLEDDCSLEVVQAVHDELRGIIEEHKASKAPDPPVITKGTVKGVLEACGVSGDHVAAFDEQYDAGFGADAALSPQNLVEPKRFEVHTPDVTIHVNPERSNLLETRVIDGTQYILIRVDENVEVNGVNVCLSGQPAGQPVC